jgi:hypothetical protein
MNPEEQDTVPEFNKEEQLMVQFTNLIEALQNAKPNDRSEIDRRFAVTVTEVEKASAYFFTYIFNAGWLSKEPKAD